KSGEAHFMSAGRLVTLLRGTFQNNQATVTLIPSKELLYTVTMRKATPEEHTLMKNAEITLTRVEERLSNQEIPPIEKRYILDLKKAGSGPENLPSSSALAELPDVGEMNIDTKMLFLSLAHLLNTSSPGFRKKVHLKRQILGRLRDVYSFY